jgi:hypothetical protein
VWTPARVSVPGAGRDDDAVSVEVGPVREGQSPGGGVEAGGPRAQQPAGVQLLVVGLEDQVGGGHPACQQLLGQWRPVVGAVRLLAHDHELSDEPLLP